LNLRIAKDGVTDHKQENNRAKGYVTRHISKVKPLPTTPLLPTRTKAPATRTKQGDTTSTTKQYGAGINKTESEEQEEQVARTPRRSERIKQQQQRSEKKRLWRSKRI
jgi:hypothetical protein